MIAISTPTYDLDGARIFSRTERTNLTAISRRVTRTATLDGGVSIYDGGHSAGDRTIELRQANPTDEDVAFGTYITRYYREVLVCCSAGVFLAVPADLNLTNNEMILKLLIKEEL
jgi:hypothetical protein